MTPDKNFKMPVSSKTRIALFKGSKEEKNYLKHMLIQSQLSEESARRSMLKSKDNKDSRGQRGAVAPE
jgi:hypothetical protein